MVIPGAALGIVSDLERLREIVFLPPGHLCIPPRNAIAAATQAQIERYLADPDAPFALPLLSRGSDFRRRVWQAISAIPRGHTRTYGELARELNSAARAVGQACGDNPFPLIVPCHRVVGADSLGGFAHGSAGFVLDTKRWLLTHESAGVPKPPSALPRPMLCALAI
jgi:methylated-DNA-[protein]-cysteine S-methyltransferase